METYRIITSLLVIGSIPPLVYLIYSLIKDALDNKSINLIQIVLLTTYVTFLFSGVVTLYLNIGIVLFDLQISQNNNVVLLRNLIKQIGILFVSWGLLHINRERGS